MADFYDTLETRHPDLRELHLFSGLREQLGHARKRSPYFARLLADIQPESVADRQALAALPVTRKSALIESQRALPPFGGMTTVPVGDLGRVFQSPGPIYDPEAKRADYWRMARALYAAGFRRGNLAHNCFSYHFTPAGSMFESGAMAIGCAVFPAGVGNTESQARAVADLRPDGYIGTPSFLKIILEKGRELGLDCSSLTKGMVSGEALPPSLRAELKAMGVAVLQCYGTADIGLIAYESESVEGMIVDEGVILEIVRPGTGDPVSEGEVGEVLVTTLNPDYPLIRFATGDLSAVLPGRSPCGRTNMRIKGWMGRADQTTKVKGMFVHPEQVAEVVKRHPEISRARLVVTREGGNDAMTLKCETTGPTDGLAAKLAETMQAVMKLKGRAETVPAGGLPNDGKVIEDARSYE
ncbi:MAG: AMP-binding protein [Alphaproteobacteria bacterium]|nr:AMP-binding protein [Alphaproteobacteria bacterium]